MEIALLFVSPRNVYAQKYLCHSKPAIFNYDGSVHENGNAGIGFCIRNHNGDIIAAKGSRRWSRSVNMMELRSAHAGLELALPLFDSYKGIILEGDSSYSSSRLNEILSDRALVKTDQAIAKQIGRAHV